MFCSALYYGVSICLVSFASAMAVVTLNIHYRGLRGAEVPLNVKTIFLGFLARIVFVQYAAPAKRDTKVEKNFHVRIFFEKILKERCTYMRLFNSMYGTPHRCEPLQQKLVGLWVVICDSGPLNKGLKFNLKVLEGIVYQKQEGRKLHII